MKYILHLLTLVFLSGFLPVYQGFGQQRILDEQMHHLRKGDFREWAEFPREPEGPSLTLSFQAQPSSQKQTVRLRQQDVKQDWSVLLNEREIGTLQVDENDMTTYFSIPPGTFQDGENVLRIEQRGEVPDDIRVGQIILYDAAKEQVLTEGRLDLEVLDHSTGTPIPSRITILNTDGALQSTGSASYEQQAVRTGVVYTGNGLASIEMPSGTYMIYAGRGFEYGIDSTIVTIHPGDQIRHTFTIRREVPTEGWFSSDVHLHTGTYARHGDATVEERILTIAGEGIEFPISTEHNQFVDLEPAARALGLRSYFTPVVGDEVTSPLGHFNIFPVDTTGPVPDVNVSEWESLFRNIRNQPGAQVVILNHGRDEHAGYRPFGPRHFLSPVGKNLDAWDLRANAMEVINSSAQLNDQPRLIFDWFSLLNHGRLLTPVGGSDAHDVARFVLGQARTYFEGNDEDPGQIDIQEAVTAFREGRVRVSFGLLTDITVNDTYGPGDLVPASDSVRITIQVLGPGWTRADRVALYANGVPIREIEIESGEKPGVKWSGTFTLPRPNHDVFLSVVAEGPGNLPLYWPVAKPYQPTSIEWHPRLYGVTGAVWIDADGDQRRTPAIDYARNLVDRYGRDLDMLMEQLTGYDEAVTIQAAALLKEQDISPDVALRNASPAVVQGFKLFEEGWNQSMNARR